MEESQDAAARSSLRAIPLFRDVGDSDLDAIASQLIERRLPKNKTIVEEGLTGEYMYIIVEGSVKVTKLSGDGREKILELLALVLEQRSLLLSLLLHPFPERGLIRQCLLQLRDLVAKVRFPLRALRRLLDVPGELAVDRRLHRLPASR